MAVKLEEADLAVAVRVVELLEALLVAEERAAAISEEGMEVETLAALERQADSTVQVDVVAASGVVHVVGACMALADVVPEMKKEEASAAAEMGAAAWARVRPA